MTYITGLKSTSGTSYFVDNNGNPKLLLAENPWALLPQAGIWAAWQTEYDNYLSTRASQGFNGVYVSPYGCALNSCTFSDGRNHAGAYPFSSGASNDPSSGLNNAFWAQIDYFFSSALTNGITVLMNIGYTGGTGDMDTGGCLDSKTTQQYTDYGTNLGNRYKNQPNIIWVVGNDYFGSYDTAYSAMLTGLRAAGDTHLITIHNFAESTSRFDISNNAVASWGTSNAQFNGLYSYDCEYLAAEYAYAEASPKTVFQLDGYFYQGNPSYSGGSSFAWDRYIRQEHWWSLASGARGHSTGDEGIWTWPSGAQTQASTGWFWANNAGNIRTAIEALPQWYNLLPLTGTSLITAGRGTRATQFSSGGGGGQYEGSVTNAYVACSQTPDKSLTLLYLPKAVTITVNQALLPTGYVAQWMDPISGARSSAVAGTTYNSTAKGNNSQGDPDWVLVFLTLSSTDTGTGLEGAVKIRVSSSDAGTGSETRQVFTTSSAPVSSLTDYFPGSSLDVSKWNAITGSVTVSGNSVSLKTTAGAATYNGFHSILSAYNLTGDTCSAEVISPGNQALASAESYPVQLELDANNVIGFLITGNQIAAYRKVATVNTFANFTAYSATNHKFVRLREASGTTYWEVSANGITWNSFFSIANPFAVTALQYHPLSGCYNIEAADHTSVFSFVNMTPVTGTDTSISSEAQSFSAGGATSKSDSDVSAVSAETRFIASGPRFASDTGSSLEVSSASGARVAPITKVQQNSVNG